MLHGIALIGHIVESTQLRQVPVEVAQAIVAHPDGVDDSDTGAALKMATIVGVDVELVDDNPVGFPISLHDGGSEVLDAQIIRGSNRLHNFLVA